MGNSQDQRRQMHPGGCTSPPTAWHSMLGLQTSFLGKTVLQIFGLFVIPNQLELQSLSLPHIYRGMIINAGSYLSLSKALWEVL